MDGTKAPRADKWEGDKWRDDQLGLTPPGLAVRRGADASPRASASPPNDTTLIHPHKSNSSIMVRRPVRFLNLYPSNPLQSRDSSATYLHLHASHHADLLEQFTDPTLALPAEDIYIAPHLEPLNPEDEDDVVPDQHAAFGIQRATQGRKEPAWRDLGLEELARRAPGERMGDTAGAGGGREGGGSATGGAAGAGAGAGVQRGLAAPRRDEPVRLALRRRPGAGVAGAGRMHSGGGAGNGLPR